MQLPVTLPLRRSHPLAWLLCRRDLVALTLRADGRMEIERADGSVAEADVHPQTTVFPWMVVLRFRVGGKLESLTLPRAATDADAHRRLRVWLRWKAVTA